MYVIAMFVGVAILIAMMVLTSTRYGKQYETHPVFNGTAIALAVSTAISAFMVIMTIELPVMHC